MRPAGVRGALRAKARDIHQRLPVQISVKLSAMRDDYLAEFLNGRYSKTVNLLSIRNLQF